MNADKQPADARKKVLIVDDHPLLREGLGKVINRQDDLVMCGEASDAPGALAAIVKCRPDVVIVDISLDEGSGLDLIKDLHVRYPKLPVLALSMHHEDLYADRALRAGASGYVMKREPASAVIEALRKVLSGQMAVSENIVNRLLSRRVQGEQPTGLSPTEALSDRELEVYCCLGAGLGTREIAAKLRIAVSTVETYRVSIKHKLGFKSATELVYHAAQFVVAAPGD